VTINNKVSQQWDSSCPKIIILFSSVFLSLFSTFIIADVWDDLDSFSQDYEYNEGVKEFVWKEGEGQYKFPPYPKTMDLFKVEGPVNYSQYDYLVDVKNLSVSADGVVRYSLIIRSSSGVDNVLYDGLQCNQQTLKHYAYGSTDTEGKKKWIAKSTVQWTSWSSSGINAYSSILARHYFCGQNGNLTRQEIIQNIKYGKSSVNGLYY
jgi:hypothetical protein